ncbi:MAG: hypothetical protein ACFFBD_18790 [Candidatus Hodarchaeota archaeon]
MKESSRSRATFLEQESKKAEYFESRNDWGMAAQFFERIAKRHLYNKEIKEALNCFLRAFENYTRRNSYSKALDCYIFYAICAAHLDASIKDFDRNLSFLLQNTENEARSRNRVLILHRTWQFVLLSYLGRKHANKSIFRKLPSRIKDSDDFKEILEIAEHLEAVDRIKLLKLLIAELSDPMVAISNLKLPIKYLLTLSDERSAVERVVWELLEKVSPIDLAIVFDSASNCVISLLNLVEIKVIDLPFDHLGLFKRVESLSSHLAEIVGDNDRLLIQGTYGYFIVEKMVHGRLVFLFRKSELPRFNDILYVLNTVSQYAKKIDYELSLHLPPEQPISEKKKVSPPGSDEPPPPKISEMFELLSYLDEAKTILEEFTTEE